MPFSLYVFDLDGTLVDSRRDLADSANALIAEHGGVPLPVNAGGHGPVGPEQLVHGRQVGALRELLLLLQEPDGVPPGVAGNVDDGLPVGLGRHGALDAFDDGAGHRILVHFFTSAVVSHGGGNDLASQAGRETGSSIWMPAPSPGRRRI